MSFLVTRPASPLPGMALRSTLCSAAIFRTRGVERRRRRSSAVSLAPLTLASWDRLGAGGVGRGWVAAAGAGLAGAARSGGDGAEAAGGVGAAGVGAAGGVGA